MTREYFVRLSARQTMDAEWRTTDAVSITQPYYFVKVQMQ